MDTFTFDAELWLYPGEAAWVFATVPTEVADEIADVADTRGFGSVRVEVSVADVTWRTSLFPDSSAGTYVLPVKRAVRDRAGVSVGDNASFAVVLLTDES